MTTQLTTSIQPTTINDPINLPDPVVNFLLVGSIILALGVFAIFNFKGKSQ
jgi:hypothetical protein